MNTNKQAREEAELASYKAVPIDLDDEKNERLRIWDRVMYKKGYMDCASLLQQQHEGEMVRFAEWIEKYGWRKYPKGWEKTKDLKDKRRYTQAELISQFKLTNETGTE